MDILLFIVGIVFLLVIAFVSSIVLLYTLAKNDWWFSYVPEGEIKFLVRGEDLDPKDPLWVNVEGHKLVKPGGDESHHTIQELKEGETEEDWGDLPFPLGALWRRFGMRWVSLVFNRRVHRFTISKTRLRNAPEGTRLNQLIERREEEVDSLWFKIPRPVLVEKVELAGDNAQIDFLILATFKVVKPTIPVFLFRGDFLSLLDNAIRATVMNACATLRVYADGSPGEVSKKTGRIGGNHLTLDTLKRMGMGKGSPIAEHLFALNKGVDDPDLLPGAGVRGHAPTTLPEAFGIEIDEVWVESFEPTESTEELAEAQRAEKTAEANAKAVVATAEGDRKAVTVRGEGEGNRLSSLHSAFVNNGVSPDEAARTVGAIEEARQVGKSGLDTWIPRGAVSLQLPPALLPSTGRGE